MYAWTQAHWQPPDCALWYSDLPVIFGEPKAWLPDDKHLSPASTTVGSHLRVLQAPVCAFLVNPGGRQHLRFAENTTDKGQAGRLALFIKNMGQDYARLAG